MARWCQGAAEGTRGWEEGSGNSGPGCEARSWAGLGVLCLLTSRFQMSPGCLARSAQFGTHGTFFPLGTFLGVLGRFWVVAPAQVSSAAAPQLFCSHLRSILAEPHGDQNSVPEGTGEQLDGLPQTSSPLPGKQPLDSRGSCSGHMAHQGASPASLWGPFPGAAWAGWELLPLAVLRGPALWLTTSEGAGEDMLSSGAGGSRGHLWSLPPVQCFSPTI